MLNINTLFANIRSPYWLTIGVFTNITSCDPTNNCVNYYNIFTQNNTYALLGFITLNISNYTASTTSIDIDQEYNFKTALPYNTDISNSLPFNYGGSTTVSNTRLSIDNILFFQALYVTDQNYTTYYNVPDTNMTLELDVLQDIQKISYSRSSGLSVKYGLINFDMTYPQSIDTNDYPFINV